MAETIDELTIDWEEDGVLTCKEIDKVVLSKGAWTTILFRYQQWDKKKEAYGATGMAGLKIRIKQSEVGLLFGGDFAPLISACCLLHPAC
jgi:hypothetical protein